MRGDGSQTDVGVAEGLKFHMSVQTNKLYRLPHPPHEALSLILSQDLHSSLALAPCHRDLFQDY